MISNDYQLYLFNNTLGEIIYDIYEMELMFDEEVDKKKGDFITFNSNQIIVDLYRLKPSHEMAHNRFKDVNNEPIVLGDPPEWKGLSYFNRVL